jgi:hypothetical protein
MASPTEPRGHQGQKVRVHLGDRRCPLCQAQAWDVAGTRVVFLVEAERVRLEKIQDNLERTGSRPYREHPGIPAGRAIPWGRSSPMGDRSGPTHQSWVCSATLRGFPAPGVGNGDAIRGLPQAEVYELLVEDALVRGEVVAVHEREVLPRIHPGGNL